MRDRYLTTINYAIGWGDNDRTSTSGFGSTHDEAMEQARSFVGGMRSDGAASAIRRVRVQHWPEGVELAGAPVLYEASSHSPC